ncbi:MAG: hypothetical protein ACLUYV_00635 [Alistipes shahii]
MYLCWQSSRQDFSAARSNGNGTTNSAKRCAKRCAATARWCTSTTSNDAEFVLFSDEVAGQLENSYPVYMEFVQMQGVDDTVDMVVVSTIVDELNADARNMRHIYPYNYLVAQGVLPAGLDHEQQKAFYNCFAAKVNATYATMDQFFNAILADTSDMSQIRRLESQCANDLFSWVVTEVDVIETVPATPAATAQTPAAPKTTAGQQTPAAPAKK